MSQKTYSREKIQELLTDEVEVVVGLPCIVLEALFHGESQSKILSTIPISGTITRDMAIADANATLENWSLSGKIRSFQISEKASITLRLCDETLLQQGVFLAS